MLDLISYSPLRISFAGGGSDISPFVDRFGGAVLNTTVDLGVTVRYRHDDLPLEIASRDFVRSCIYPVYSRRQAGITGNILDLEMEMGVRTGRIIISNDVPPGSGLGSSSALTVASVKLADFIGKMGMDSMEIAESAYRAERERFGITLGKQDPYAVTFGGMKLTIFEPGGGVRILSDISRSITDSISRGIILVYTGKTRESSIILSDQVKKSSGGDPKVTLRLGQLRDLAITMWDHLKDGNLYGFYEGINKGWEIKKDLSPMVTNDRVDRIISTAMKNGAEASKLLGGGSQGFVLVMCREERTENLARALSRISRYVIRAGIDYSGARIY